MGYLKKLFIISVVLILTTVNSFALKAEYRFEDCSGKATTKNHQPLKLDGKLSGDAKVVKSGKIKNGLTLSGNGAMSIKHDNNLDLIESLTISFWIYPKEYKREALIVKGNGGGDEAGANAEYSLVLWESGKFKYKHNGTADTFSKSTIPLKKWTHIALVRDNIKKTIKIYINGKLDATNSYTIDPSSSNSEKLLIGTGEYYSKTMGNFNGKLDEIKIYNLALKKDDIEKMYKSEKSGKYYTGECKSHTPPKAIDDSKDLPITGITTVAVLSNDIVYDTPKCELDKSTLKIASRPDGGVLKDNNKTLIVPNEGVWSVTDSGEIKFISNSDFYNNPTDISYTVADSCGGVSNHATISLTRVISSTPTPTPTVRPTHTPTPMPTPTYTPAPTPITTHTPTPIPTPTPTPTADSERFTIGDRVWYDNNRNGIQDESEEGVEGVRVVLYSSGGEVVETTKTNASGEYSFNNIERGKYTIGFTNLPSGYIFTEQNVGDNDEIDSDVNSAGRVNINVTKDNLTYDAGIIATESGSGEVGSGTIEADCDCKDYKSTPSLTIFGTIVLFLLVGLLGTTFIREEKLNKG